MGRLLWDDDRRVCVVAGVAGILYRFVKMGLDGGNDDSGTEDDEHG